MTITINRDLFFAGIRKSFFKSGLRQKTVDGINDLLDAYEKYGNADPRNAAYIFAGVFHETGALMYPVRECFASMDSAARVCTRKRSYGKEVNGHVYYGRGRIQNTWLKNYVKLAKRFGIDCVDNPDLLLDSKIDAMVTVVGHFEGIWTGRKLSYYITDSKTDYVGARHIINGTDKAEKIAGYAKSFEAIFRQSLSAVPDNPISA